MTTTYTVKTQDVDCSTTRKYKTLAAARKRFEEMAGHTMEVAIGEQFYRLTEEGKDLPKVEEVKGLRAVSDYGTVVVFRAEAAQ